VIVSRTTFSAITGAEQAVQFCVQGKHMLLNARSSEQKNPRSFLQFELHPSPDLLFPSSHSSSPSIIPNPHPRRTQIWLNVLKRAIKRQEMHISGVAKEQDAQ
jgi:hypothetical protein